MANETSTTSTSGLGTDSGAREPVLHPVDRIMELLFGLLMALSFTGAMSVAQSGREQVRELFIAALGCNLAWGLVDAVMYLVRTAVARGRIVALPAPATRAKLSGSDWLAALAIFIVVVVSTFPVVLPFALMHDIGAAKNASRVIALVMLFLAGFALGRYAGYGSWRAGFMMALLGVLLVGAIKALGG